MMTEACYADARRLVPKATAWLALIAASPGITKEYDPEAGALDSLTLEAVYTSDIWRNVSGGIREDTAYLDNLDFTAEFDAESALGWNGTRFFLYGLYNNGTPFSETIAGDAQVISNIETGVEAVRLYEAWVEKRFDGGASVLFGLYDLNSEFDLLDSAGLFLNSAHGIGTDIGQTGENGPSIFPATSLALRLTRPLTQDWTVRFAVMDGVPGDPDDPGATRLRLSGEEGVLIIGEFAWNTEYARVLAGAWRYTAEFERLDAATEESGKDGLYLRGEWSPPFGESRPMTLFSRIGTAEGRFNTFDRFFSAGATHRLVWRGRPGPQIGVAVAVALASDEFLGSELSSTGERADDAETNYELTARIPVNGRLSLQPSVQYVVNPGLRPELSDALALGLRFEVSIL